MSTVSINPIPGPSTGNCTLYTVPHFSVNVELHQNRVRFDIAYKATPEWCILDSEDPTENHPAALDETLPTTAEEP